MIAALLRFGFRAVHCARVLRNRNEDFRRIGIDRERKTGRHHSDHSVRLAVERDRFADDRFVVLKVLLPERVTQDHSQSVRTAARFFLIAPENAAEHWTHTENIKKFARDLLRPKTLRRPIARQSQTFPSMNRDFFEAFVLRTEIEKIRITDGIESLRLHASIERAKGDQSLRLRKWERLEQNRVNDAEDGGVRANADREREDRDDSETRFFEELAESETNVLHDISP